MLFNLIDIVKKCSVELHDEYNYLVPPYDPRSRIFILNEIDKYCDSILYTRKYELLTNIVTPKGFEIHHIDSDRNNNHISNLVLMPRYLHKKYHWYKREVEWWDKFEKLDGILFDTKLRNADQFDLDPYNKIDFFTDLLLVLNICNMWVELRDKIFDLSPKDFGFNSNYEDMKNKDGFVLKKEDLKWERP